MTWKEINDLDRATTIVVLPIGSTEQHGERLPLHTDIHFAECLAKTLCDDDDDAVRDRCVLLPSQNFGMSWHHTAFPGTISLSEPVFTLVIQEILESLLKHGFKKILIINGHGGNDEGIERAISCVKEQFRDATVENPVIQIMKEQCFRNLVMQLTGEDIIHAGAAEASIVAETDADHLRPAEVVTCVPSEAKLGEGTSSPSEWAEKFPQGQKGDQRKTDPEIGGQLFDAIFNEVWIVAKQMAQ